MTVSLDDALTAIWNSIENWPAVATAAPTLDKIKEDCDGTRLDDTGDPMYVNGPTMNVFESEYDADWFLNRTQRELFTFNCRMWLPGWESRATANALLKAVRDALYQAAPTPGADSYIKTATGYHPTRVGPAKFARKRIPPKKEGSRVLEVTLLIVLENRDDPLD